MRIKKIQVDGYRNFRSQQILLEEDTTVLAGANNSGKTSLIDLLTIILRRGNSFSVDDFDALARHDWSSGVLEALIQGDTQFVEHISNEAFENETPKIEVLLEVSYDKSKDDIREFADFLMDLDLSKSSFYFIYRFAPKLDKLREGLRALQLELLDKIKEKGWKELPKTGVDLRDMRSYQSKLCKVLFDSCAVQVYFSDSSYEHRVDMEQARFHRLFNVRVVQASRPLDDTVSDKTRQLSQRFVNAMKGDERWDEVLKSLPDRVIEAIDHAGINSAAAEAAVDSLNKTIDSISKTSGEAESVLFLDFQLEDTDALGLVVSALQARYDGAGVPLGERSQGLGYSNLIILHLEVEAFVRDATKLENKFLVNLIIVEEPESHMHPQMQNAFIKHLFHRVQQSSQVQAVVTTHANEIVRLSNIEYLRVLKVRNDGVNIVDLKRFHTEKVEHASDEVKRLFSLLYAINFADVLFADKVVMYEGDTERMYIEALVREHSDLARLKTQYISYVQVGGTHAHTYLPLIVDALKIKTVIITDIDYKVKDAELTTETVQTLSTTNATLNNLFSGVVTDGPESSSVELTVEHLLAKVDTGSGVALVEDRPGLAVSFQGESEGFARTLEEAVLAKGCGLSVWEPRESDWWKNQRRESQLAFSIPRGAGSSTIQQVVTSTSNRKTDFMYSLILKSNFKEQTPDYILNALKWLSND